MKTLRQIVSQIRNTKELAFTSKNCYKELFKKGCSPISLTFIWPELTHSQFSTKHFWARTREEVTENDENDKNDLLSWGGSYCQELWKRLGSPNSRCSSSSAWDRSSCPCSCRHVCFSSGCIRTSRWCWSSFSRGYTRTPRWSRSCFSWGCACTPADPEVASPVPPVDSDVPPVAASVPAVSDPILASDTPVPSEFQDVVMESPPEDPPVTFGPSDSMFTDPSTSYSTDASSPSLPLVDNDGFIRVQSRSSRKRASHLAKERSRSASNS